MSPTGGRRPATQGIFAIEQQEFLLPDPIALDTSFVVEALLATQPLHPACSAFLERIFDSGVAVVTSDLLVVELAESAFAITLKERWGGGWRGHRTDGRSRRPATRRLSHTISRYETLLLSIDHLPVRDAALVDRSLPGTPCRRRERCKWLHGPLRDRLLRRGARSQRHRRRRQGNRYAGHRLRSAASLAPYDLHRPLTTRLVPQ